MRYTLGGFGGLIRLVTEDTEESQCRRNLDYLVYSHGGFRNMD